MTNIPSSLTQLPDRELLSEVRRLVEHERQATARLIAALAELDVRRLYLGEGCSSLFTYCTQVLHLSEHAAYGRIEAARAARQFPAILALLADGSVTLTAVGLLRPHLTADNHQELLNTACHKSKRDIEHLVAGLQPKPALPATVRKLPAHKLSTTAASTSAPLGAEPTNGCTGSPVPRQPAPRRAVIAPLAPAVYKLQFSVGSETYAKLRRVQDLLRHAIPNGDPAVIFDRALTLLLSHVEKTKYAATDRPRTAGASSARSRHVPSAVRRAVWTRDGGQCAFMGTNGRCTERGLLEFHHLVPYAAGGETVTDNLELRCRAHNGYEAMWYFGGLFARERGSVYTPLDQWCGGRYQARPFHGTRSGPS